MDSAINALKPMLVTQLSIVTIWCLAWLPNRTYLEERALARNLVAWIILRDQFPTDFDTFDERYLSCADSGGSITRESVEVAEPYGGSRPECVPFEVEGLWPRRSTYAVVLSPHPAFPLQQSRTQRTVYAIQSSGGSLPFSDYCVVVFDKAVYVVPAETWRSERQLHQAQSNAKPSGWDQTRAILRLQGASPEQTNLKKISLGDGPVLSFLRNISGKTYSVMGFTLDAGLFVAGIGIILDVVAISQLGPFLALRRTTDEKPTSSWTLVAQQNGFFGRVLEALLLLCSLLWIIAPLAILWFQVPAWNGLLPHEEAACLLGGIGLAGAAVVNLMTARQLREVRRR